jgi:hypothetical protein
MTVGVHLSAIGQRKKVFWAVLRRRGMTVGVHLSAIGQRKKVFWAAEENGSRPCLLMAVVATRAERKKREKDFRV